MRIILAAVTFLLICTSSYSQTLTVTDQSTGLPLELVTIVSERPRAAATTNARGQADIHLFQGSESIEIRILGYKPLNLSFGDLEKSNFKVAMNPSGISLDELIISAARWNQKSGEVPARISSITPKTATLQNPQTSADLLATSGEVFIQKSQQGGGSPMIRGFSTNRLLYAVDGVRMNTAIFRSGNLHNVISLDPFAMENTDLIFGPGSVIYGSDAIGGVMSFTTLTPQFSFNDSINLNGKAIVRTASANDEKTGHLHLNAGWKKFAMLSSFSYFNFGHLKMGSHGPDEYLDTFNITRRDTADIIIPNSDPELQFPTAYRQFNFMQKFSWQPNDFWKLDYGFHYSETSDFDRFERLNRIRNSSPASSVWYYGPQKWMMNLLTVNHRYSVTIYDDLTIRIANQLFEESRIDRDFNDTELRTRTENVSAWSFNADLTKFIGNKSKLFYGVEGIINYVESKGMNKNIETGLSTSGPSRYPESDWSSYAVYLNYQNRTINKILVQAGVRYNYYLLNARFDTTFYPFPFTEANINNGSLAGSAGIVFTPTSKWAFSLNASTGFRSPNVDDMGKVFDSESGSVVVPNPGLKAETAINFEAGIAKIFGEYLKIDLTGYYTILEDAMVRRDFRLNGLDSIIYDGELSKVQAVQNAASATVYGIQAGVEIKIINGLAFSSRANYQKGEEELENGTTSPLRHAAPFFASSHLTFNHKKWSADLSFIYNAEVSYRDLAEEFRANSYLFAKDENGNPYSPAWYTLNLKGSYNFTSSLLVTAGIENMTDQRYRTYSSGVAAAGRNFILSASYRF